MSYIQALKKPIHNKTFSYDYDYKKTFATVNMPKLIDPDNFINPVSTETNGNDADIDEEEKAKINKSFSVEIVEQHNSTPERNPSELFVGHLKNNISNKRKKEKKKTEFMHFIDETINYFEECDKTTVPSNSIVSTKRKKMKNFHYSIHNDKAKSSHCQSQVMDEMNSIYVIQNQKLLKNKKVIEEMKHTQKTLVNEIAEHQEREKAYLHVI